MYPINTSPIRMLVRLSAKASVPKSPTKTRLNGRYPTSRYRETAGEVIAVMNSENSPMIAVPMSRDFGSEISLATMTAKAMTITSIGQIRLSSPDEAGTGTAVGLGRGSMVTGLLGGSRFARRSPGAAPAGGRDHPSSAASPARGRAPAPAEGLRGPALAAA